MSDVFQLSESGRVGYFRWTSGGAIYAPSPAPTALLYALDGTSASITLTQQGSGTSTRYYADLSETGAGLYEIVASTTDSAADCAAFQAEVRIGQDWIQTLNGLVQAIWDKATSALTTSGSIGAYLLAKLGLLGTTGATVPTDDVATGDLTFYVGTDYAIADGSNKSINDDYAGSLSGASADLLFAGYTLPVTISGSAGAYVYEIECSQAQGAAIGEGDFGYSLVITLASTHKLPPRAVGTLHFLKVGA